MSVDDLTIRNENIKSPKEAGLGDDIVNRLREYNPVKGFIDWKDTMDTAADEIERLRKELADTRSDLRRVEMQQIRAARRWR